LAALSRKAARLHENRVRLKIIGDMVPSGLRVVEFAAPRRGLRAKRGLTLTIARQLRRRWDLMQALLKLGAAARCRPMDIPRSSSLRIWPLN